VNLRLDHELDGDLITWMEAQPRGALSQALREALRRGLEPEQEVQQNAPDYEFIRQIVADELARALAGLRFKSQSTEANSATPDAEAEYGARLDQMLGNLSSTTDPGEGQSR
jgi:hypothetical protein